METHVILQCFSWKAFKVFLISNLCPRILKKIFYISVRVIWSKEIMECHDPKQKSFTADVNTSCYFYSSLFNPIQNGLFRDCYGWEDWTKRFPFPKICHTYPTIMKTDTLPKEDPEISKVWALMISAFFHRKPANFAISINTDIEWILYIISNCFTFFWIFKVNMVTILIMSAKIATVGLLKTKVFWNKGYDIIITVHDLINKILSCD